MTLGIPSYHQYIVKAKMLNIFSIADGHKLKIIEEIINGSNNENNNRTINEPNDLISKLEYSINHTEKQYKLQITPNIKNLGIQMFNNVPLIIEFNATQDPENNMFYWQCQFTKGYSDFLPKNCKDHI